MNKRIKKKRKLLDLAARLQRANNLQQEIIEDYGRQLGEAKRELADLRVIVERNAQATNGRFNYLEKKVADKVSKKSWFGRKYF